MGKVHDRLGRFLFEVLRRSDMRDPRPLFALGFRLGIALGEADPALAAKVRRAIEIELASERPFRTVSGLDRQATEVARSLAAGEVWLGFDGSKARDSTALSDDLGIREGG